MSERTSADSRSTAVTASERKPGAAGCAATAGASPALPLPGAFPELRSSRLERPAPAGRERRDPERALQPIARMLGRVEQRVDLRHRHPLGAVAHLDDGVAGAHLAFLQDPEVEPRPPAGGEQGGHPGLVHPDADPITGHPGLGDLEHRAADPVAVADAHGVVGQAFDGEVLAELSGHEAGPPKLLLPVAMRLELVDEDGALLAPMPGQVALAVAGQVQPARRGSDPAPGPSI